LGEELEKFMNKEVGTIENGIFLVSLCCLYYHLFSEGVKAAKAKDIIRAVAQWCRVKIGKLPMAMATANCFRTELNGVMLLQLAETLGGGKHDATLQQDDPSKFHDPFFAYEVCYTEDDGKQRVMTLGLTKSWEKTVEGVANTYNDMVDDVQEVAKL
jgi:hypothetical protein